MSTKFEVGDRVVYSGEVINEAWDVERRGTVIGVRMVELIDIKWDHGASNYGQFANGFSEVVDG